MRKKNLFENAHRGDFFETRNGETAILLQVKEDCAVLIYENNKIYTVLLDGCYHDLSSFVNPQDYLCDIDIIGQCVKKESTPKTK